VKLKAFYSYYPPFLQTLNRVEELTLLLSFEAEVLEHFSDWSARTSETVNLLSEVIDD